LGVLSLKWQFKLLLPILLELTANYDVFGNTLKPHNFQEENTMADKKADLAVPGIGNYEELEKILPRDYSSIFDAQRHATGHL